MKVYWLLLLIPFENLFRTLGFNISVYSFPTFSILGSFFLLIILDRKKLKIIKAKRILYLLFSYLIFASLQIIFITDSFVIYSFFRALLSATLGFISLEIFEYIFSTYTYKQINKGLILGYLFIILFSVYEIFKGVHRVKATFTEPAHLGEYLVFIYIPWFLIQKSNIKKVTLSILLGSLFLIILLTFSTTTYIRLLLFIMSYMMFRDSIKAKMKIIFGVALLVTVIAFTVFYTENYAKSMIMYSIKTGTSLEDQSQSFIDRFSFWIMMFKIKEYAFDINSSNIFNILFGSGLGNESNLNEYVSETIYKKILSCKGETASKISNLWGKFYVYGGFFGLTIYFFLCFYIFRSIKNLKADSYEKSILFSIMLTTFLYQSIGNGYFHTLSNWFFMAYIFSKLASNNKKYTAPLKEWTVKK
jgi:hypothetical protein